LGLMEMEVEYSNLRVVTSWIATDSTSVPFLEAEMGRV
jgi:hypothetical protein